MKNSANVSRETVTPIGTGPQGVVIPVEDGERQTCPRRMGEFGPWKRGEGLDRWDKKGDLIVCSFCGGLHPDMVMDQIEAGTEVIPTDKNYKGYLKIGPHGQQKFYFQHFGEDHRTRLIDKLNDTQSPPNIAFPGHFYVRPYFVAVAPFPATTEAKPADNAAG